MENEFNTSDTLTGEGDIASSGGGEADSVVGVKDVLSEVLGKEFPSDEIAIKSVKDTYSYVGKMGQEVKRLETELNKLRQNTDSAGVSEKINNLEKTLKDTTFFAENPEYKEYRDLIKTMGNDPAEVIKSDIFKSTYEKLKTHNENEKSKSVLMSNPRLGQVTDKISQAKEQLQKADESIRSGNIANVQKHINAAESSAVEAVIDAYGLRGE